MVARLHTNSDKFISIPFDAKLCYKFVVKKPELYHNDVNAGDFLIGNSRKEYLQSKYYNHSRWLEEFLRTGDSFGEPIFLKGRGEVCISESGYNYFKAILLSSGLHLEDRIVGSLFLVREMLVPVFAEMLEEKFHLVDYRNGITEEYFTPALYCDLGKQRPTDPEMQPYSDLIGKFYPHLVKLRGVREEKKAIVLFGILLDTANFSRFIIEAEAHGKSIRDWLYRKLREKFYNVREGWRNPFKKKESTSEKRRKKELGCFSELFEFLTDLKNRPEAPACELRISRRLANSIGIDPKSKYPIPQSVICRFINHYAQYEAVFSRLGLWPE